MPTSLPDILKPFSHRGYNQYSKGSLRMRFPAMNERYIFKVLARLDSRIKNYEYSALYALKISASF